MLEAVFADVASSEHPCAALEGGGVPLVELLVETGLASSKREARQFLSGGSIAVNGQKIAADAALERALDSEDLLHGGTILLRRGKKVWHCTRWQ